MLAKIGLTFAPKNRYKILINTLHALYVAKVLGSGQRFGHGSGISDVTPVLYTFCNERWLYIQQKCRASNTRSCKMPFQRLNRSRKNIETEDCIKTSLRNSVLYGSRKLSFSGINACVELYAIFLIEFMHVFLRTHIMPE